MTTIEELLNRYANSELHPTVIDMAGALFELGTRRSEVAVPTPPEPVRFVPFAPKTPSKPKLPIRSESELLFDVIELVNQTFRLKSSTSSEAASLSEKTAELTKYILESARDRVDTRKTELESLRGLTDTIIAIEAELVGLREMEEKRRTEIEQKKDERDAIKAEVNKLDATRQEFQKDISALQQQLNQIHSDTVVISNRREEVKVGLQQFEAIKKQLEALEMELVLLY